MTHSVHPYSHRLGILRDWKSRWFTTPSKYKQYLKSDVLIRQFLEKKLRGQFIADIQIERSEKLMHIIIETSRKFTAGGFEDPLTGKSIAALIVTWWLRVSRLVALVQANLDAAHFHQIEEFMRWRVAERGSMLKIHQPDKTQMAASGVIVHKHVLEGEQEVVEVEVGEAGLSSEGGREVDIAAV